MADGVQDGPFPGGEGGVPAEPAAAAPGVGGRVGPEAGRASLGRGLDEGGQRLGSGRCGVLVDRPDQRGQGVEPFGERAARREHQALAGVAAQDVDLALLAADHGKEVQSGVLGPEYRHDVDHGWIPSAELGRTGSQAGRTRPGGAESGMS